MKSNRFHTESVVKFAPLKLKREISLLNAVKISFDVKMTFEVKINLNFKCYNEELKSCNEAMSIIINYNFNSGSNRLK